MAVDAETQRTHESDAALVRACLAGDEDAWEELVDRYGRLVYSIPRRLGLSAVDADDVFQNVFAALFRRLADLRDQSRLTSWLITTTYRECWRAGKQVWRHAGLDATIVDVGAPDRAGRAVGAGAAGAAGAWPARRPVPRAVDRPLSRPRGAELRGNRGAAGDAGR